MCPLDLGRRIDHDALVNLATAAVSAFLHNSLYESVKRFLSTAQGSFGLCVTCSLDVDRVALAAWNQPMSIGFAPTRNLVVYGSESNAVRVPLPGTRPDGSRLADADTTITYRLDIDNVDGEARRRAPPQQAASALSALSAERSEPPCGRKGKQLPRSRLAALTSPSASPPLVHR